MSSMRVAERCDKVRITIKDNTIEEQQGTVSRKFHLRVRKFSVLKCLPLSRKTYTKWNEGNDKIEGLYRFRHGR